jgi:hypothetical protein
VFGSRARELNVSTGSGSATTTVIGKMSAEEIVGRNGIGVLRLWQGRHGQTLIENATIETAEIGNAPIAGGRIVIDPTASGSLALLHRQSLGVETATIEIGEIGNAPTAEIPIVPDRIRLGSPTHPDRQSRVIETATSEIAKMGSVLVGGAPIASPQIASGNPIPLGRGPRVIETVTTGIDKTGSVLIVVLQIVSDQIESGVPAPQTRKHGRIAKVSSGPNAERGGGISGKIQPRSKDHRCADQVIPGPTDVETVGNRSDPIARTTKPLAPIGPPIASAPVQSQGAQSHDQKAIRGPRLGLIEVPRG